MTLARTHSVTLVGVQGHTVEIEADIENGLVALLLVGLPDTALREARDRIRAAIVNSREDWPQRRITVGLSPASLPKRGSSFDLGLAVSILAAAGAVPTSRLPGLMFLGELGLDGRVRAVRGVLPSVAAVTGAGFSTVVVPAANAAEASLVPGVEVLAAETLAAVLTWLRRDCPADGVPGAARWAGEAASPPPVSGARRPGPAQPVTTVVAGPLAASAGSAHGTAGKSGSPETADRDDAPAQPDLSDVVGQPTARKAAELCAAGGHHLLLLGPPGAGKTMLAERLPTLLPRLDSSAALEVSAIHSVAGVLPADRPLLTDPPFCAPHHTATRAALVGGGSGVIRPGAASLAHHGCLFLDEAPEFARDTLDALRQPLESGEVVVARSGVTARFPARFTLVMAANPCPCARAATNRASCTCAPAARRRYLARLSGPLLDRVDVKVEFLPVSRAELLSDRTFTEPGCVVAARVQAARERTAARLRDTPWRLNAEIPGHELSRRFAPPSSALAPLERAMDHGEVSARGAHRIIRLAWTAADLRALPRPGASEISYALGLWLGTAS